MSTISVRFDRSITVVELKRICDLLDCQLRSNARGELIVTPRNPPPEPTPDRTRCAVVELATRRDR